MDNFFKYFSTHKCWTKNPQPSLRRKYPDPHIGSYNFFLFDILCIVIILLYTDVKLETEQSSIERSYSVEFGSMSKITHVIAELRAQHRIRRTLMQDRTLEHVLFQLH